MATFEKLEQVNVLFIVSALKRIFLLLFSDAGIGHAVGVINFDRDVLKHDFMLIEHLCRRAFINISCKPLPRWCAPNVTATPWFGSKCVCSVLSL